MAAGSLLNLIGNGGSANLGLIVRRPLLFESALARRQARILDCERTDRRPIERIAAIREHGQEAVT